MLVLVAGALLAVRSRPAAKVQAVGLFTTLPILWNEDHDVTSMLKSAQPPHWARALLTERGPITAIDSLAAPGGNGPLAAVPVLVMAQPRPLGPQENVALDSWVRGGGRLLLLADPALTEDSNFAIGDPRRPQSVVLLSPILRRWGLDLQFDEAQDFGERRVTVAGLVLPVNLPGRFAVTDTRACTVEGKGLVATCRIGRGRVLAVADAAVLSRQDDGGARAAAFSDLLDRAFAD